MSNVSNIAFTLASWTDFVAGIEHNISYTAGNGMPVSLVAKNATWDQQVVLYLPVATQTWYRWTPPLNPGTGPYTLLLTQGDTNATSPPITIALSGTTSTSSSWATSTTPPANWSSTAEWKPTGTATGGATITHYWDPHCGCTKKAAVPTSGSNATGWQTPAVTPGVAEGNGAARLGMGLVVFVLMSGAVGLLGSGAL